MADGDDDDMPGGMPTPATADKHRHGHGPRPLSALLPALVRPAFRRRAPATAQVLADWDVIVGPAIAAVAMPLRLSAGTLSIACAGPMAMELAHVSDALLGRINGFLGQVVVHRLRFVQSAALHRAVPAVGPARPRGSPAGVAAAIAGLPDGELRDALERLARSVLAARP